MLFEPKNKLFIIIPLILLIAGVVLMVFLRGDEDTWIQDKNGKWVRHGNPAEVTDFTSCAKYFPILETYPEQCKTPDGKTFTQESIN